MAEYRADSIAKTLSQNESKLMFQKSTMLLAVFMIIIPVKEKILLFYSHASKSLIAKHCKRVNTLLRVCILHC